MYASDLWLVFRSAGIEIISVIMESAGVASCITMRLWLMPMVVTYLGGYSGMLASVAIVYGSCYCTIVTES